MEYNRDVQQLFIEMMLHDAQSFVRVQNIFNVDNFDQTLQPVAKLIEEHSNEYNTLPDVAQVRAVTSVNVNAMNDLNDSHYEWFLDEFEKFTKRQELERAILKSADLLEDGDFDPVEKIIKDAVQISLTRDMGTNYFADPRARLEAIKDNNGQVTTGWPTLDKKLYGGFSKGELEIFAGGSGTGKSVFMQNLAVNYIQEGLNCVFITLELSEDLCSMRIDAMTTGTASKNIFKDIDNVEMKVKMLAKKSGQLHIKYLPAQSNVNDIRSYIKELEIQTNLKIDVMCVDYLDLLMPVSVKVSPSDLFVKDKYVSEELRNLAKELDVVMITASQLNRCLALDTKIIANGKEIEIKDVQLGDWLESSEGPVRVYEKMPITTQSVYKVKTKSGKEIVCSARHKFPTSNGLKTIETGLAVGDYLRSVINSNSNPGKQDDN